jgi:peptidoglycan lytic transglycosylase G
MMDDLNFAFEDGDERNRRRRRAGSSRRSPNNNHQHGGGYGQEPYYAQQDPYYPPPDPYRAPNDPYYPPQQNPYPGQHDPYYQDYQGGYPGYSGYGDYEQYPQQTRSQRNAKNKKKKKKKRSKLPLILGIVLLVCLGGGYVTYNKVMATFMIPDYTGDGSGDVTIEIKSGANGTQIAKILLDAGVIKSTKAFIREADKNREQADRIQPGTYKLRKQMSAAAALALLLDPKSRQPNGITIQEGLSTFKIYKLLAERLKIPEADFKKAAEDPAALGITANWFTRKDGKPVSKSIEGFLFPDTYDFPPKATAKDVLTIMVKRFLAVAAEMKFVEKFASDPKVSPYQALIVASLAQAEAGNKDDLGKVARVAYNRVYKRIPQLSCACLEMDVTVNYSLELRGLDPKTSSQLTEKELTDPANPYNRKANGLVPTPINNPGKLALAAAQNPPEGTWYWFVAIDKEGHSAFSSTFAQFCLDNQKAVAAGVLAKSSC